MTAREREPDPAYLAGAPSAPVPIVLIGAGGIARDAHLPAYAKAGFPVVAIVDRDESRASELAASFAVEQTYTDIADAVVRHGTEVIYDVAVMPDAFVAILEALPDGAAVLLQK